MSAIEVNKIVGAILAALLLTSAVNVFGDALFSGHGRPDRPVYLVAIEGAAPAEAATEAATESAAAAVAPIADRLAAADPAKGKKTAKKCTVCHSFDQGGAAKIGPNLWDVVGHAKGATAGFAYSSGMAGLGGAWDYDALDGFLASPKSYLPGTKMAFPGLSDPAKRADVIAFLRTLSDSPLPLPGAE